MVKKFRVKCPSCGTVLNVPAGSACTKCGSGLDFEEPGMIEIYRMGNFVGSAVGYGIYLNDQPMGHVADRESVFIPVPYGTYKLHFTCGMNRKCNDPVFEVTPEDPRVCVKVHIKMGFITNKLVAERVSPDTMPKVGE